MTVMLGDDNKMVLYGFVSRIMVKEITFGKDGLRKEILEKTSVLAYTK
jgi:hypothetical protein